MICQINVLCDDDELEILRDILFNRIMELDANHLSTEGRNQIKELRSKFDDKYSEFKTSPFGSPEHVKCYGESIQLLGERLELFLK